MVEEAELLDKIYKHLEKPESHVRLLFADFSSAFNKMQPHILIQPLSSYLNLPHQFLLLLLIFLTERRQQVWVNGASSDVVSNPGSPQGEFEFYLPFFLFCVPTVAGLTNRAATWWNSDDAAPLTLLQGQSRTSSAAVSSIWMWTKPKILSVILEEMVENIRQVQFMGTRSKLLKLTSI